MAITNGYLSLEDFKAEAFHEPQDTTSDVAIERIINAVSRKIDEWCFTRFYTTTADETYYYTAAESGKLYTDDILSLTTLATDEDGDRTYEVTWASTDYDLNPV